MTLRKKILALVEGALMLAMATVLGYFRLYRFPFGGSIDLALVPVLVYCLRWGGKWGTLCALIYGVLEYFLGGGISISWQSMLLDYVGCNVMTGLCGLGCGKKAGWLWGTVLAHLGRLAVLVLSGGLLWYMYMPEEFLGLAMVDPWIYALLYNGVLTAVVLAVDLAALYLLGKMDLGRQKILTKQY